MLRLDEAGRINWAKNVKNMLFMYGIGFVWIVQEQNIDVFLCQFRQRLNYYLTQKLL